MNGNACQGYVITRFSRSLIGRIKNFGRYQKRFIQFDLFLSRRRIEEVELIGQHFYIYGAQEDWNSQKRIIYSLKIPVTDKNTLRI